MLVDGVLNIRTVHAVHLFEKVVKGGGFGTEEGCDRGQHLFFKDAMEEDVAWVCNCNGSGLSNYYWCSTKPR